MFCSRANCHPIDHVIWHFTFSCDFFCHLWFESIFCVLFIHLCRSSDPTKSFVKGSLVIVPPQSYIAKWVSFRSLSLPYSGELSALCCRSWHPRALTVGKNKSCDARTNFSWSSFIKKYYLSLCCAPALLSLWYVRSIVQCVLILTAATCWLL